MCAGQMALTVGVGTIMDAREVLILVSGQHKVCDPLRRSRGSRANLLRGNANLQAHALAKCLEDGVNHMYTLSALQLHPRACVVCDEDSTNELRVRSHMYGSCISVDPSALCCDLVNAQSDFVLTCCNPYAT